MPRLPMFTLVLVLILLAARPATALEPGELLTNGSFVGGFGLMRIGPFGGPPEVLVERGYSAFALDTDGTLVANIGNDLVRVDLSTGNETLLSTGGPLGVAPDLVLVNGFAYGVDDSASIEGVVRVDLASGVQTIVASKGNLDNPQGLVIDESGTVYVADPGDPRFFTPDGEIVAIDPDAYDAADPLANQSVLISGLVNPLAIAFDTNGDLLVADGAVVRRFGRDGSDKGNRGNVEATIRDLEVDAQGDVLTAAFDTFVSVRQLARIRSDGSVGTLNRSVFTVTQIAVAPGIPQRSIGTQRLATQLERPVYAAAPAGDDRVFIVEQTGAIHVWKDGALLPTPFLDLSLQVAVDPFDPSDERGLLGLAFAPDYAASGLFYVMYVAEVPADPDGAGLITIERYARSAGSPDQADPQGALLLSIPKPGPPEFDPSGVETFHNGGHLAFGPDGRLYAGVGDGGTPADPWECAQNANSPLGKLLRFDLAALPPGGIAAIASAQCPVLPAATPGLEIFALGLRNPYRFSFDWQSGDLYIGDVGESIFEEIDILATAALQTPGWNFGWDVREGTFCSQDDPAPLACPNPDFTDPVLTWVHQLRPGAFCTGSVIGGPVYRGAITQLVGHYFFADYCQRFIRSLTWNATDGLFGALAERDLQLTPDVGTIDNVVAIGEDGAGELLVVDYGSGFTTDGELFRVVAIPEPGAQEAALAAFSLLVALHLRARLRRSPLPSTGRRAEPAQVLADRP